MRPPNSFLSVSSASYPVTLFHDWCRVKETPRSTAVLRGLAEVTQTLLLKLSRGINDNYKGKPLPYYEYEDQHYYCGGIFCVSVILLVPSHK